MSIYIWFLSTANGIRSISASRWFPLCTLSGIMKSWKFKKVILIQIVNVLLIFIKVSRSATSLTFPVSLPHTSPAPVDLPLSERKMIRSIQQAFRQANCLLHAASYTSLFYFWLIIEWKTLSRQKMLFAPSSSLSSCRSNLPVFTSLPCDTIKRL